MSFKNELSPLWTPENIALFMIGERTQASKSQKMKKEVLLTN